MEDQIEVGVKAPDFTLEDQKGDKISLSEFKGKYVILYFYPKDNTPGCTKEAKDFAELSKKFSQSGAVIIGISPDSMRSHQNFAKNHSLPFFLLSDQDKRVAKSYNVFKQKYLYGKMTFGIERSTFLIDKNGVIEKIWRGVKVPGHAKEVVDSLK